MAVVSRAMHARLQLSSAIREAFESAEQLKSVYGAQNVFDFSIGNPSAPSPGAVADALRFTADASSPALHGYTDSAGYEDVRTTIAQSLQEKFGTRFEPADLVMTTGAACALNSLMHTLLDEGDEVVVFAPYYSGYRAFISNWNARMVVVPYCESTLLPDLEAFAAMLTERTKLVLVNTPNNPSGLVYPPQLAQEIARILLEAQRKFDHEIVLVSDEPYRELCYEGVQNPWWPALYQNTAVVYSWSKSASVAGERIGYVALPPSFPQKAEVLRGVKRSMGDMGFVNAPATGQRIAAACAYSTVDIAYYDENRRALFQALVSFGFAPVAGNGAFYLLVPAPDGDEAGFVRALAAQRIIVVAGSEFGAPGFVRLSYCVSPEVIERALPAFQAVARAYGLQEKEGRT